MSVTDPAEPVDPTHDSSRPTGGVDWASADHAVSVVAPDGEQIMRFSVTHDAAGLRTLVRRLLAAGVSEVGIERPDGPVVDALRQAGLSVLRHPPRPAQEPAVALRLGRQQGRPVRRLRAG